MHPLLALANISFSRNSRPILSHISWQVLPHQIAAILGPNGSGKSTLLRIISGYLWPQHGTVQLLGQTFGTVPIPPLRARLGIVEATTVYPFDEQMTARDVVLSGYFSALTLSYRKITRTQSQHATHLLAQVGLAARATQLYHTLSTGERLRTLLARALVRQPDLLLLDEPTAGLDLPAREAILATLAKLLQRNPAPTPAPNLNPHLHLHPKRPTNKTRPSQRPIPHSPIANPQLSIPTSPSLITITHHLEELLPQTSNILLLSSRGTTIAQGPPKSVLTSKNLSAAYNLPIQVQLRQGRYSAHINPSTWTDLLNS